MVQETMEVELQRAQKPEMAYRQLQTALSKLGNTPFEARSVEVCDQFFIPTATLNALKKQVVDRLAEERILHFRPQPISHTIQPAPLFEEVTYKANVVNEAHKRVYEEFGADRVEEGLDKTRQFNGKELMVCKYCIRYEMGMCSRQPEGRKVHLPWYLSDGTHRYRLEFDCARCEMKVFL